MVAVEPRDVQKTGQSIKPNQAALYHTNSSGLKGLAARFGWIEL